MATKEFKTYINDEGMEEEFCVFLIHGHSDKWQEVSRYIQETLKFKTIVSVEEFTGGSILQKIKNAVWFQCDCAVALLTPDDELNNGMLNARPNAIFELGYCMGFWDYHYWDDEKLEPVIIIKEKRVQINSDLNGMEFIEFEKGKMTMIWPRLKQGLERIYNSLKAKKSKPKQAIPAKVNTELKKDFQIIKTYLNTRGWHNITFEKLIENVHSKFDEGYILQLIEAYPTKLTRTKLNGKKGVKLVK